MITRVLRMAVAVGGLLVLGAAACSSEGAAGSTGAGGASGFEFEAVWEPCNLDTQAQSGALDAECATVTVPSDWDDPAGATIELFIKRRLREGSVGQLWMLAGGPGASTQFFEGDIAVFDAHSPVLDTYLLDHRGTGKSSFLGCTNTLMVEECLTELAPDLRSKLEHFSVTNAAHDLGHVIERLREPGVDMFVYALSYGTILAQRYLWLYPEQPTAVVLDSACADGEDCYWTEFSPLQAEVGSKVLDYCARDPACAGHFQDDPNVVVEETARLVDGGHCSDSIDGRAFRTTNARLLGKPEERNLLPAFIHRVTRCEAHDRSALDAVTAWIALPAPPNPGNSSIVYRHIVSSEYMPVPAPTPEEAAEDLLSRPFGWSGAELQAAFSSRWPTYERDEGWGQLPDTAVPILMLAGELDPFGSRSGLQRLRDHLSAPHQSYVEVPTAVHYSVLRSRVANDPDATCGGLLMKQFLEDPEAPLDTSCTDAMPTPTFTADDELLLAVFGTTDMWGD